MMTIKEYADRECKSVQAVYKQLKHHTDELDGHIVKQAISGKLVTYLDDEAIKILDAASRQSPTVVVMDNKDAEIKELQQQLEAARSEIDGLKTRLIETQDQYAKRIADLSDRILLLTDRQQEQAPVHKWWRFWK